MSETAPPPTYSAAWAGIADFEKIRQWQELVPDAPERVFKELETQAKHLRRRTYIFLACALFTIVVAAVGTIWLASMNQSVAASIFAGSNTLSVVSLFITGRTSRQGRKR